MNACAHADMMYSERVYAHRSKKKSTVIVPQRRNHFNARFWLSQKKDQFYFADGAEKELFSLFKAFNPIFCARRRCSFCVAEYKGHESWSRPLSSKHKSDTVYLGMRGIVHK